MKGAVFAGLSLVLLIIVLIIFGPFLLIWSLNTLFGLAIPFTFKTWFASLILGAAVKGGASASSSSKS
jgi:hypothetical protein